MIYKALWKALPGPVWSKVLLASLMFAVVVSLLFTVVFPWIEISLFAPPTIEE